MSTTQTPRKPKPTTTERQTKRKRPFWAVILTYHRRSQSLVNNRKIGRMVKPTAADNDFVKDVESATRFALQGMHLGLLIDWHRLAKDNVQPAPEVLRQIIELCAPVYHERGLKPDFYFREKSKLRKLNPHEC